VIADNRIAENAGWNEELLRAELTALREENFELDVLGFAEAELGSLLDAINVDSGATGQAGSQQEETPPSLTLAERFGIPPFSVLNAREGWWQNRKRAWIDLGIRSELGRGAPMPLDRANAGQATAAPGGSPLAGGKLLEIEGARRRARPPDGRRLSANPIPGGGGGAGAWSEFNRRRIERMAARMQNLTFVKGSRDSDAQQFTGVPHSRGGDRVGHRWAEPRARSAFMAARLPCIASNRHVARAVAL
jgi:hypothetical protein